MSFGMIMQNQNKMKKQICVIWIQTAQASKYLVSEK